MHLQPFGCILVFEVMKRDIFQAIADPTRRAIIALIALQAMTPNAIAEHFDTTRQAVSKHLRILTECELVRQEQKGTRNLLLAGDRKNERDRQMVRAIQKDLGDRDSSSSTNVLATIKKQKKEK